VAPPKKKKKKRAGPVIEVAPPRKRKRAGSKIVEVAPPTKRRIPRTGVIVEVAPETSPDLRTGRGVIKEMAPMTRKKKGRARPVVEIAPEVRKRNANQGRPEVAPNEKSGSWEGATASGRQNCRNWSAIHDFMPPRPARLRVRGECTFPTPGFKVTLKRAVPQGINPTILILEKTVTRPTGIEPQHVTTITVEYEETTDQHIAEVLIMPDDTRIPVQEVH
jgi:hypothetical protein